MAPEEVSAPTEEACDLQRASVTPCTRSRIEVEAQLRRFSTDLAVVNRVLWDSTHTSYARVDSESDVRLCCSITI